jgi:hypothetical protein
MRHTFLLLRDCRFDSGNCGELRIGKEESPQKIATKHDSYSNKSWERVVD